MDEELVTSKKSALEEESEKLREYRAKRMAFDDAKWRSMYK